MLVNRTFRVGVEDTLSPYFDQVEGVPQGSVLSVPCFALIINDIVTAVPDGVSCSLYVDDFLLYLSGSTFPSAVRRMHLATNRVVDWTDSHGFLFSVEKSHAVLFRRTRRDFPEPSLILYCRHPSVVREVRFLGMTFYECLTWAPHLSSMHLTCQSPLDLLLHLSHTTLGVDMTTFFFLSHFLSVFC